MPEITEADLLKNIKERSFYGIYFIYGEDVYLRQSYVRKLTESIVTELVDMNLNKIDGKNANAQKISDLVYQIPLMSDKRCVLIEDYDVVSAGKEEQDALVNIFSDIPESTVIVMVFNSVEVDKKKSGWNTVVRSASKYGAVIDCKYKTDAELTKYIGAWANKRGVVFDKSVAKHLIESAGRDLKKLQVEVDKLCAYKNDYVSKEDIDKLSAKTPEATQYMLPKAVLSLNISSSLNILSDLLDMRYDPIVIVSSLADSFIDIYRVKTAIDCGKQPRDIAESFGYAKNRLFVLDNAAVHSRKYSFKTLSDCFDILDEADEKLKSGEKNKRLLLEKTVILIIETLRGYNTGKLK